MSSASDHYIFQLLFLDVMVGQEEMEVIVVIVNHVTRISIGAVAAIANGMMAVAMVIGPSDKTMTINEVKDTCIEFSTGLIPFLGGRNNYRDSNNYGRDGGDRDYGNRRFDNRNKGGDDDWDFEQNDNRGPPRRTPRSEDDFSRMRGGDRGGGGRGTPYNRDRGGGYEERGSRGGRDERDGNRGGNDHRYSRDGDPRGGRGNGPRDMDGGGPPKQSYVPPENDDCEGERIRMGKNFAKYEDTDVKITGPGHEDIQPLDTDFENSNLVPLLRQHLRAQQFERPTPVQKCAIPCILADKDIMACAQTGSGKTAAFLLPVISRLIELGVESREMNRQVPDVVIVIPTRELAVQVHYEARRFCKGSKLVAQVLYGGTDVRHQKSVSLIT